MLPHLIKSDSLTVFINGVPKTLSSDHKSFASVVQAIKDQDWTLVEELINLKDKILSYGKGKVRIEGNSVFYRDFQIHGSLVTRILSMLNEGFDIDPMVAFLENLMLNPCKDTVRDLYSFLEKGNLPITPDGHFLAYKKVDENYMDCYTRTVDNSPTELDTRGNYSTKEIDISIENGLKVIRMLRNQIDTNPDRTCSKGLHFCSYDYLNHYGGEKVLLLKINPRDVVSIPSDYNQTKARCCEYIVLKDLEGERIEGLVSEEDTSTNPSRPRDSLGRFIKTS